MEKDVPIVVVKEVGKSYGTVEALKVRGEKRCVSKFGRSENI